MVNPVLIVTNYVRSSIAELKKVSWPTQERTLRYSAVVIVLTVAVAAFFAALDFGFSRGISFIISQKTQQGADVPLEQPVVPNVEPIQVETTNGDEGTSVNINADSLNLDTPIEPSFIESEGGTLQPTE